MGLTSPDGSCDVVGCLKDALPPDFEFCEDHIHPCSSCGHGHVSHRWGGANVHGEYTFLSSCRKCVCGQFKENGEIRRRDYD